MIDLTAIKARVDAATPDWKADLNRESDTAPPYLTSREGEAYWPFATALWRTHQPDKASEAAMVAQLEADFEFAAHARADVPALLAEVERLRGLVKDAYYEGSNKGVGDGHPLSRVNDRKAWEQSDAANHLTREGK